MTAAAVAAERDRAVLLVPAVAGVGGAVAALDPTAALAVAVAVPFLALTSLPTKVLTYFGVLPLVWWLQIRLPSSPVRGVPSGIAVTIALHLAWELVTGRARLPLHRPFVMAVCAFGLMAGVQVFNPVIVPTGAGLAGARVYLEPLILFFAGLVVLPRPHTVERFLRVVVVTSIVVGVVLLRQALLGLSTHEIAFQARDQIRTVAEQKLFSTLPGPAVLGFVAAAFMLLCLLARSSGIMPRLALTGAALSGVGVIACGVRMSLVAALVAGALTLLLLIRDPTAQSLGVRTSLLALGAAVVLAAVVAAAPVGQREDTFEAATPFNAAVVKLALLKAGTADVDVAARIDHFGRFRDYVLHHPLGAGPGLVTLVDASTVRDPDVARPPLPNYILDEHWIFQHNSYYAALGVELGLVPLVLFTGLLIAGAVLAVRRRWWYDDRRTRAVLDATAAVAILTLLYGITNESFRFPQVSAYVWFLLAAPVVFSGPTRSQAGGR